jgi:cbb3-type cytochrome oxidase maturation protein
MMLTGLILISLALGLAAWLGFVWSVKSGQYDDPEGPKYRMLDEEEEVGTGPAPKKATTPTQGKPKG